MRQWEQTTFTLAALGVSSALFVSMLLLLEVGRRLGLRAIAQRGPDAVSSLSGVDAAVYSLLALLMGFAFSGAAARFEHRKQLVVKEVSALSTAWQRTAVFPAGARDSIQSSMRQYTDALITTYASNNASSDEQRGRAEVSRRESELWARSVAGCVPQPTTVACMLLLPSLNELFDVVDQERLERNIHLPRVVVVMLLFTALAAALFAGQTLAKSPVRNWIYMLGIAATVSLTTYVILELEYPRAGLIRVNAFDQALREFRAQMR